MDHKYISVQESCEMVLSIQDKQKNTGNMSEGAGGKVRRVKKSSVCKMLVNVP
jgi:hypothetical protein